MNFRRYDPKRKSKDSAREVSEESTIATDGEQKNPASRMLYQNSSSTSLLDKIKTMISRHNNDAETSKFAAASERLAQLCPTKAITKIKHVIMIALKKLTIFFSKFA